MAALPTFAPDRVVELPARLERTGATPLVQEPPPSAVSGLLQNLAEYQWLTLPTPSGEMTAKP